MEEQKIKIQIFVIQCLDWLMIIGLLAGLYYAYLQEVSKVLIVFMGLSGLVFIQQVGLISVHKIHTLQIKLKHIAQEKKQKEIDLLMSKGGQKVKKR